MIPVRLQPKPEGFEDKVRQPGLRCIRELLGDPDLEPRPGRPRKKIADRLEDIPSDALAPYWRGWCLDELYKAYDGICAYSCLEIEKVTGGRTVDHFIPLNGGAKYAYEWSNYRLACSKINARKRDLQDVVDPFEVEDDWFELDLTDFSLRARTDSSLSDEVRGRIKTTIDRLLSDSSIRDRHEEDFNAYMAGLPFWFLERRNPLLARELKRKGRLRPEDRAQS